MAPIPEERGGTRHEVRLKGDGGVLTVQHEPCATSSVKERGKQHMKVSFRKSSWAVAQ